MKDQELNDKQLEQCLSSVAEDLNSAQGALWQCFVNYRNPEDKHYYNYIRENILHIDSLIDDVVEEIREIRENLLKNLELAAR